MNKPTVYIETSVISYLTARPSRHALIAAYQRITKKWWERSLPNLNPFISFLVLEEISKGDKEAAALRVERVQSFSMLEVTANMLSLGDAYFRITHLPEKARMDSYHLAIAAYHGIDYLISWNFRHILNAPTRMAIQTFNEEQGMRTPVICSPEEMLEDNYV